VHRAEWLASAGFEKVRKRSGSAFDAAPRRVDRKWALSRERTLILTSNAVYVTQTGLPNRRLRIARKPKTECIDAED
jgi:hypothetical protein